MKPHMGFNNSCQIELKHPYKILLPTHALVFNFLYAIITMKNAVVVFTGRKVKSIPNYYLFHKVYHFKFIHYGNTSKWCAMYVTHLKMMPL